jgi:integrase
MALHGPACLHRASPVLPEKGCFPVKLDAKTIADLTLPMGKPEQFFWDSELKGFGYRLRRGSDQHLVHRTWVAQYRANGRTRRSTWPAERLAPAQAREAARQVLAQVTLGGDPQGQRKAERVRSARSFRSAVDVYLEAKAAELRPVSLSIADLYLRRGPYFRTLHPIGIAEITHTDIAARLSSVTRNHSTTTAGAARRAISALYVWAIQEGWATTNPVIGTRKPPDPPARDRVLSNTELATIWNACGDDDAGRILRLLILLASRKSEVGGMRWSELDLTLGTWTLPKERSKNHRSHTVTLPPAALEIIRSVPLRARDHLFGDRSPRGFTEWHRAKLKLDRKLARAVKPWRVHDIRRTVATKMADDVGIEPHHVEAVLNHYGGHRSGIAGVYNRARYEIAIASALRRWSEHVLALVEGRESNVVNLQRA